MTWPAPSRVVRRRRRVRTASLRIDLLVLSTADVRPVDRRLTAVDTRMPSRAPALRPDTLMRTVVTDELALPHVIRMPGLVPSGRLPAHWHMTLDDALCFEPSRKRGLHLRDGHALVAIHPNNVFNNFWRVHTRLHVLVVVHTFRHLTHRRSQRTTHRPSPSSLFAPRPHRPHHGKPNRSHQRHNHRHSHDLTHRTPRTGHTRAHHTRPTAATRDDRRGRSSARPSERRGIVVRVSRPALLCARLRHRHGRRGPFRHP